MKAEAECPSVSIPRQGVMAAESTFPKKYFSEAGVYIWPPTFNNEKFDIPLFREMEISSAWTEVYLQSCIQICFSVYLTVEHKDQN